MEWLVDMVDPKLCQNYVMTGGEWAKLDICKGAKGILWSIEECTTFYKESCERSGILCIQE